MCPGKGRTAVGLPRLCGADHVGMRAEHDALLETQLERLHQFAGGGGMHVVGLDSLMTVSMSTPCARHDLSRPAAKLR
ncbi:MAG: hypothetical protein IPF44_06985 [Betaproteobacteria bacterium]|nr:hypothetical protein [Betaproteobacteria bacterium]